MGGRNRPRFRTGRARDIPIPTRGWADRPRTRRRRRWARGGRRPLLDGFGLTIRVESGHDSTTVSQVDTQYAPCGCSPLGKMYRVSMPYAPGGTPAWTTYAYDERGRTVSVTTPDGSVTQNSYYSNQTTIW